MKNLDVNVSQYDVMLSKKDTELIDSLSEGTKEARLMEEKIADRDKRIKKLRMIVKKILKCRDCGRDVTLNELMR